MTPPAAPPRPLVVLHDHLDGGLRPETALELADACGHVLPATDVASLRAWFHQGRSGSLERYLEAFVHTVGVMQTADAVERVAYEAATDLAADGVVYAEVRFDPGLCTVGDLDRFDVVEAALAGLSRARRDTDLAVYLVVSGLRHLGDTMEAARAAVRFREEGVVGFDIAGPEAGFPPMITSPPFVRQRTPVLASRSMRARALTPLDVVSARQMRRPEDRTRRAHHRRHRLRWSGDPRPGSLRHQGP